MENQTKGLQRVKIHKTHQGLVQIILDYGYGLLTSDLGYASAEVYDEVYARLDNIVAEFPNVLVTVGEFQCTLQFAKTLARRSAIGWGKPAIASAIHMDRYLTASAQGRATPLNEFGKGYVQGYTEGKTEGKTEGLAQHAELIDQLTIKLTNLGYEVNKLEARNRNTKREFGERLDKAVRLIASIKTGTLGLND